MEQITTKASFRKILVIDDNATDRYIAKRMAEKYHFAEEIVLKESAPDALEYLFLIESIPSLLPEFIFLDINMPEMNGFEFLEQYAKLSDTVTSNCVILMVTSSTHTDDLLRAKNNPLVIFFFNKPLDKEKFEIIKKQISIKKTL